MAHRTTCTACAALVLALLGSARADAQVGGTTDDASGDATEAATDEIADEGAASRDATSPESSDAPEREVPRRGVEATEAEATDSPSSDSPSSDAPSSEASEAQDDEGGLVFYGSVHGTYQLRGHAMSDIPLTPFPWDPATTGRLGQNYWATQWLRARAEVGFRDVIRLVGSLDALWGIAFGETAMGTRPAAWPRDEHGYPGVRLRHLYLEWQSPIGILRIGQMGFSWGLGIVANDGETPPPFGDYWFGDLVRRVLFVTRPFGDDTPFVLAAAADWVAWDLVADFERGDTAFQGVVAGYWQSPERADDRIGGYVAYRTQKSAQADHLDVFVADVFAHLSVPDPSGGRFFAAAEAAYVRGTTSLTRTVERPQTDVEQLLAVVQLGRTSSAFDLVLEGGYASGDSNVDDGFERRATMDPDHRVGLVLFPELIAWQTARSAFLAQSPELFGRGARGAELLPTNGGVAGAFYFFPYGIVRPTDWLDLRAAVVIGWASTDVVDPWRVRAESRVANYRGGDPGRRDLGVEVDAAIRLHGAIGEGVELSGGLEGGLLFPGRAFDDAAGRSLGEVGLARLRLGISY